MRVCYLKSGQFWRYMLLNYLLASGAFRTDLLHKGHIG
jgi:hypothetical protein